MKRDNILISEDYTTKRVAVTKFTTGNVPVFDCSIHFGEEGNDVTMQNCNIKDNAIVKCSPDDTYDFETGALIALMKMCGVDKVVRACNEAFSEDTFKTYATKYERELNELKKDSDKVIDELIEENETLKKEKEQIIVAKNILYNNLEKENERLEEEKKHLKDKYERCQHILHSRTKDIHRLENEVIDLKTQIGLMAKKEADLIDKVKKLEEENKELKGTVDELFDSDKYWKSEAGRLTFENHRLEEKVEKLKLDCEKLQHGYLDTDMIFCGGRQNGKQYTFLVELFKKLDQKKVDAAYKEAYNTTLPVWQKEVLKQMHDIYKESKDKRNNKESLIWCRSQPSIRDQLDSLLESSKCAIPYTTEWIKPPTKREEMWENIFELHKKDDIIIKVKREDVNTFLHEIEKRFPEITWASSVKIFETKYTIDDIYRELKTCDEVYFRLWKETKLSYSCDSHIHPYRNHEHISYLPPMRWDLFKKGRIVIGVRKEQYDEFRKEITQQFGVINKSKPYDNFNYSFFIFDKNANFIEAIGRSQFSQIKELNNHKVYYWEDVR